jgi:hypothetical protein
MERWMLLYAGATLSSYLPTIDLAWNDKDGS